MRVRAGTIVSFANRDSRNEKLVMVILLHPVATPGMFEVSRTHPWRTPPKSFFF